MLGFGLLQFWSDASWVHASAIVSWCPRGLFQGEGVFVLCAAGGIRCLRQCICSLLLNLQRVTPWYLLWCRCHRYCKLQHCLHCQLSLFCHTELAMLTMQVPSELTLPFKMCLKKNRNPQLFVLICLLLWWKQEFSSRKQTQNCCSRIQRPMVCAHIIIFTFLNVDFPLK